VSSPSLGPHWISGDIGRSLYFNRSPRGTFSQAGFDNILGALHQCLKHHSMLPTVQLPRSKHLLRQRPDRQSLLQQLHEASCPARLNLPATLAALPPYLITHEGSKLGGASALGPRMRRRGAGNLAPTGN
jgi:hypothetical protein